MPCRELKRAGWLLAEQQGECFNADVLFVYYRAVNKVLLPLEFKHLETNVYDSDVNASHM